MSGQPDFASPDRSVEVEDEVDIRRRLLPPYHVVLLDDDDHTFEYVIHMLTSLFGMPPEKGFKHADEVNNAGRSVVCTTSKERAELKQEQIHAFGPDKRLERSQGSMSAIIEPAE